MGRSTINADAFKVYVRKILVPNLRPGDIVVMDNLSKRPSIRAMIEAAGLRAVLPAALQPRPQPDRESLPKFKANLCKAAERTVPALWDTISRLIDVFTPAECANYFTSCGDDAD